MKKKTAHGVLPRGGGIRVCEVPWLSARVNPSPSAGTTRTHGALTCVIISGVRTVQITGLAVAARCSRCILACQRTTLQRQLCCRSVRAEGGMRCLLTHREVVWHCCGDALPPRLCPRSAPARLPPPGPKLSLAPQRCQSACQLSARERLRLQVGNCGW